LPRGTARVPDTQREKSMEPKKETASSEDPGGTSVDSVSATEMGLSGVSKTRSPVEHAAREAWHSAGAAARRTVLGSNLAQAFPQVAVCSFARAQQIAPACRPQVQQRHEHIQERGHAGAARVRLVHSRDLREGGTSV
jgi:hypothetical protein